MHPHHSLKSMTVSFLSCSKDDEELPPAGVTKNLLAAFRDMQRSNETVRNMRVWVNHRYFI